MKKITSFAAIISLCVSYLMFKPISIQAATAHQYCYGSSSSGFTEISFTSLDGVVSYNSIEWFLWGSVVTTFTEQSGNRFTFVQRESTFGNPFSSLKTVIIDAKCDTVYEHR